MKKIIYLSMLSIIALFSSCDDKETEDISRITYFPILEMSGDPVMVIEKGSVFTDPGVTAVVEGMPVDVTVDGTVDSDVLGAYSITYSALNKDGFSASMIRSVVVQESASITGNDYSGTYKRTYYSGPRNGGFSEWVATSKAGVYIVNDIGGTDSEGFLHDFVVVNVKDNLFIMPEQVNPRGGTVFTTSTASGNQPDLIQMTSTGYIWSVKGSGYGTALRTFEKQ